MHGRSSHTTAATTIAAPIPILEIAVVRLDDDVATIARGTTDGAVETVHVTAEPDPTSFLARVAHEVRDRRRVQVSGPETARLALERELVTITHHPDQIVDTDETAAMTTKELAARVRTLAAA